jgi:hypothetical protein
MGYYIETPIATSRALQLASMYDAEVVERPESINDIPRGKTLICVVQNGMFDAAAIVYSDYELDAFSQPGDPRPRTWMLMDREDVVEANPHVAGVLA